MKYVVPFVAGSFVASALSFGASAQTLEAQPSTQEGASGIERPARLPARARMSTPRFTGSAAPAEGLMGIARVSPSGDIEAAPMSVPTSDGVIELDANTISAIEPLLSDKASTSTISQACMPSVPDVVVASASDFRADPSAWIANRSDSPRRLLRDVRSIAISDPQIVDLIDNSLLSTMEPGTRHAIGVGVGRAARTCVRTDPEIFEFVENSVLDTKDNSLVEGYLLEVSRSLDISSGPDIETPSPVASVEAAPRADEPTVRSRSVVADASSPANTGAAERTIAALAVVKSEDNASASEASAVASEVTAEPVGAVEVPEIAVTSSEGDLEIAVIAPTLLAIDDGDGSDDPVEASEEVDGAVARLDVPFTEEVEGGDGLVVRPTSSVSPTRP